MKDQETQDKVIKPRDLFLLVPGSKRSYIIDGKFVNLEFGVPNNCVDLYLLGGRFPYLKLKKGAEVLFEKLPETEIIHLINETKVKSDVQILSKLITSEEGKARVATRLKELKSAN